jgi:hypothetical protein
MDDTVSWKVLLTGSMKDEIRTQIDCETVFSCDSPDDREELFHPGRIALVIFCPGDEKELEKWFAESGRSIRSSGMPAAIVLPRQQDTETDFPVTLVRSDFAAGVIRKLAASVSAVEYGSEDLSNFQWERIGSLQPFLIHNMNNILARIMGNIELAGFHNGNVEKIGEKLAHALEGAEELRRFLEQLARYSMLEDIDVEWTPGNGETVNEFGQMSSGTAVEFSYQEMSGIPRRLPYSSKLLNLITGLISASATVAVNGCGLIDMTAFPRDGRLVEFRVSWNSSSSGSGLCSNSMDSAACLLSSAALLALRFGLMFRLDGWDTKAGSASLSVPISKGGS